MLCMGDRSNSLPTFRIWIFHSSSRCCCSKPCFGYQQLPPTATGLLSHSCSARRFGQLLLHVRLSLIKVSSQYIYTTPLTWGCIAVLNFRHTCIFPETPVHYVFLFHCTWFTHRDVSRVGVIPTVVCCLLLFLAVPQGQGDLL